MMPHRGHAAGRVQARWLVIVGLVIGADSLFHMARFNLQIDFWTAIIRRA